MPIKEFSARVAFSRLLRFFRDARKICVRYAAASALISNVVATGFQSELLHEIEVMRV
jgi:hypothetical protein